MLLTELEQLVRSLLPLGIPFFPKETRKSPRHAQGIPMPSEKSGRVARLLFQGVAIRRLERAELLFRCLRKVASPGSHSAAERWQRPPMASADIPYAMRLVMFTGNWMAFISKRPWLAMLRSALKAVRPKTPLHKVTWKLSQARAQYTHLSSTFPMLLTLPRSCVVESSRSLSERAIDCRARVLASGKLSWELAAGGSG